jgi:hypothetical protein
MSCVLVVESDPVALDDLLRQLTEAGMVASGVTTIADIERWPEGQIVITDLAHFTPWWREVGAAQVIVLVDSAAEALPAMRRGATGWLVRADCGSGLAALGLPRA